MTKKVIYIALDGKEFDTEMKCREYEENHSKLAKVRKAIDTLKNYCRENDCDTCPFFSSLQGCKFIVDTPNEWEF